MLKTNRNSQRYNLIDYAKRYLDMGYSILPVKNNKMPAVPWKRYMNRFAPSSTHSKWWERDDITGVGILTGSISHLAVLDFDNFEIYLDFREKYPHLARTYTVRTRRGVHLYFRIPSTLSTQTRKLNGVDWLWNGCYVVAPPSNIQGIEYRVIYDHQALMPKPTELSEIESFISSYEKKSPIIENPDLNEQVPIDLITHYQKLARQGRNNALFQTACLGRDGGYTQLDVTYNLLAIFTADQRRQHEPSAKRETEGLKTIASAFSKPARAQTTNQANVMIGLPNKLREKLLQHGLTAIVRVWEGLKQRGIDPSTFITEKGIQQTLKDTVGHHSIRKALTIRQNDKDIFKKTEKLPKRLSKLCNLDRVSKSKKITVGRKTIYYRLPTIAELCRLFEVDVSIGSDPLTLEDLKSVRKTRFAMHRAFLHRCPGHYPKRWLAKRLGISIRSLQRYNAMDTNIRVIPVFLHSRLTWQNLDCIADEALWGTFLEDGAGKRYPALKVIAKKFLRENRLINYLRQCVNYYCYGISHSHLERILLRDPIMEIAMSGS